MAVGIPPGFTLRCTLRGHENVIHRLAWSPDGRTLASGSIDKTVRLWDGQSGEWRRTFKGNYGGVYGIAWSPDGRQLATGSDDHLVRVWDVETGKRRRTIKGHDGCVFSVAWSPDGKTLASASDGWLLMHGADARAQQELQAGASSLAWSPDGSRLAATMDDVGIFSFKDPFTVWDFQLASDPTQNWLAWSPDGSLLGVACGDATIQIVDVARASQIRVLEGHVEPVTAVSFDHDGSFVASKSIDGTVRLWRCDSWNEVAVLDEGTPNNLFAGLAFHPRAPVLATLGGNGNEIRIWDLNLRALTSKPSTKTIHYANAKVVLLGDSGVGKSGLGRALMSESFIATESTHGRKVWTLETKEARWSGGKEIREILLWDLAGQPGYRLIHQLHLHDVVVALVVFDSRSETDPFAGARHWERALRQAQRIEAAKGLPMKKFLVAARVDRGGIGVSRERIDALMIELGFDGYFETSAKESWGIPELADKLRAAVGWEALPRVSSTELFHRIKGFLRAEKETGRLLATSEVLYRAFCHSTKGEVQPQQFSTCIGRLEAAGLIRRLGFADQVLLQPELIDAYASALVNAAKDEPDGLGSISVADARAGRFRMSGDERLADRGQEQILLIAMVDEVLGHEIALREPGGDDGDYLVFPSQVTNENPDLPDPEGKSVVFTFEGPILNVYSTLVVRLSHSDFFRRQGMWKNAAAFAARAAGTCGVYMRTVEEGRAELTLFFDEAASAETRFQFEDYVAAHLRRRALGETLRRRRIFRCGRCNEAITDRQVLKRRELGKRSLRCPVCDTEIAILDEPEGAAAVRARSGATGAAVVAMDRAADARRDREQAASLLAGKIATRDFDVYLCHGEGDDDGAAARRLGEQLREQGLLPWLREEQVAPGTSSQKAVEQQILALRSAAVLVGPRGVEPWQDLERQALLRQLVKRGCRVIPVILDGCDGEPELPLFLRELGAVDLRRKDPDPLRQLVWGITGERPPRPVGAGTPPRGVAV